MQKITTIVCLLMLCAVCGLADISAAASPANPQSGRRQQPGPIFPGIDLTDEQKATLQTIRQSEREQIEAIRNNSSLSQEEKRAQIEAIHQATREQSLGVLTPEQQQTIANRRANGDGPGPGGRGGGIPGLTDEQRASLGTIRQSEREQIEAVRNDQTLSQEEKRARIESIRQESRQQSQGVLTPEQQEAIKNRRASGQSGPGIGSPGMGGRRGGMGNGTGFPGGGTRPGGRRGGNL